MIRIPYNLTCDHEYKQLTGTSERGFLKCIWCGDVNEVGSVNYTIILAMKYLNDPESVGHRDRINSVFDTSEHSAPFFGQTDASNAAFEAVDACNIDDIRAAEKAIDKYFKITGEEKQHYIDKINEEKK